MVKRTKSDFGVLSDYKTYDTFYDAILNAYITEKHIITTAAIGRRLKCSPVTVHRWRYHVPASDKIFIKLAQDFNLTVEEVRIIAAHFRKLYKQRRANEGV